MTNSDPLAATPERVRKMAEFIERENWPGIGPHLVTVGGETYLVAVSRRFSEPELTAKESRE
jgi:hypothetical protein